MEVTVKNVQASNPELASLIRQLDEDLLRRYPAEDIFGIDFSDPRIRDVFFAVAYVNDVPAGCGAIRPLDRESAELKRFFVDSSYRRKGIAKRLLDFLEGHARERNFRTIRLEAGDSQPEALAFYKKHGYYAIDRYGEYADCESSLCFEKQLD